MLTELCKRVLRDTAPVAIIQLPSLPRGDYGKVQRPKLIEMALQAQCKVMQGSS